MTAYEQEIEALGPWSLTTSRTFWEGFTPSAPPAPPTAAAERLRAVFRVEADWSRAQATVSQHATARRSSSKATATCMPPPRKSAGSCPWTSTDAAGPRSLDATRSSPTPSAGYRACGPAASTHRTRPRPGRCCPNASASRKPHGRATTSSTATATTAPACHHRLAARSALSRPGRVADGEVGGAWSSPARVSRARSPMVV